MSIQSLLKSRVQTLIEIWTEVRHGREAKIIGAAYAAAAVVYTLLRLFSPNFANRVDHMPAIATLLSFKVWLILALVILLLLSLEGAYRVIAKVKEDVEFPKIELEIRNVVINPLPDGVAHCFVDLLLRSTSEIQSRNPDEYYVTLRIQGNRFSQTAYLNLSRYRLTRYRDEVMYDSDGNAFEGEKIIAPTESLLDIRFNTDKLTKGFPIKGWLGADLYGLPSWPYHKNVVGQHSELVGEENQQYPDEIWVDDVEYIPHTGTVEEVTVRVVDAYGRYHDTSLLGPFNSKGIRIRKSNDMSFDTSKGLYDPDYL
jgi:hypothetical protein